MCIHTHAYTHKLAQLLGSKHLASYSKEYCILSLNFIRHKHFTFSLFLTSSIRVGVLIFSVYLWNIHSQKNTHRREVSSQELHVLHIDSLIQKKRSFTFKFIRSMKPYSKLYCLINKDRELDYDWRNAKPRQGSNFLLWCLVSLDFHPGRLQKPRVPATKQSKLKDTQVSHFEFKNRICSLHLWGGAEFTTPKYAFFGMWIILSYLFLRTKDSGRTFDLLPKYLKECR